MSEHFTDRFAFSYYDHGDEPWEDGMNKNFLTILDNLLIAMWGYHARLDDPGVPEVGYYGGLVRDDVGDTFTLASSGVMPVTISTTNYFERDEDGVVYVSAVGMSAPSVGRIPMFSVDVDAGGVVTNMDDYRSHEMFGAGAGSVTSIDDLDDVDTAGADDGDVLTWDDSAGEWVPAAPTGGGGSAPTTPAVTPLHWFKADAGITKDGSNKVTGWANQGTGSGNLVGGGGTAANCPLWVAAQWNGLDILQFDGAGDYMAATFGAALAGGNKMVFAVMRQTPTGGGVDTCPWIIHSGSDYSVNGIWLRITGNQTQCVVTNQTPQLGNYLNMWFAQLVVTLAHNSAGADWMYVNGDGGWSGYSGVTSALTSTTLGLGGRLSGGTPLGNVKMDFAEILIYDTILTDDQINETHAYLIAKWGIDTGLGGGGGGATELADLTDVNLTGLSDGDVLTWDSGSSEWVPEAPSGGALALDDLTDVDTAGETTGDVLAYTGTEWIPVPIEQVLPDRANASFTTASLATDATDTGTMTFNAGVGCLLQIGSGSEACWLRFYVDADARTADAGRDRADDPVPGTGVLAEFIFLTGGSAIECAPPPILYNNDIGVGTTIYWALTADEAVTGTYTITCYVLPMGDP